jgi:Tol biopolymer transport system component
VVVKGSLPRWMPGGRGLSYLLQDAGGINIWVQPLDGSAPRQITHVTDGRYIGHYA